ncbi:hypothetical protein HPB49_016933 [Dermacentor silvarum]|uniref:Uncharacterized protein n=1 Tax=Dermacentor silvarum TaxID=543639 RepID=A0ACB8DJR6_DERSI|nr:hypothetical protein HPB49_016933 [Dermacentor silvarum]
MRPHPDASEYKGARDERNAGKNRSQKILAADSKRPLLNVTMDHSKTDYINAVYVDGFRKPNAFLVTQMPLCETMDDFWEMVASSGSKTVVTLGPLPDQNPSRMLKQFHCPTWRRLERVPGSHDIVLDMLRRVDTWQMLAEGAPVIVQCL